MQALKDFNRRRRDAILHMGAALSARELTQVRRMRWVVIFGGLLLFVVGISTIALDSDWTVGLFFCALAALMWLVAWPMVDLMLRGYAHRHALDTRGRQRFDPGGINRGALIGASGGGGLIVLAYDWLVAQWQAVAQSWPWFW